MTVAPHLWATSESSELGFRVIPRDSLPGLTLIPQKNRTPGAHDPLTLAETPSSEAVGGEPAPRTPTWATLEQSGGQGRLCASLSFALGVHTLTPGRAAREAAALAELVAPAGGPFRAEVRPNSYPLGTSWDPQRFQNRDGSLGPRSAVSPSPCLRQGCPWPLAP